MLAFSRFLMVFYGLTRVYVGDRLMAGRQTLTLSIKVRILVPQPERVAGRCMIHITLGACRLKFPRSLADGDLVSG